MSVKTGQAQAGDSDDEGQCIPETSRDEAAFAFRTDIEHWPRVSCADEEKGSAGTVASDRFQRLPARERYRQDRSVCGSRDLEVEPGKQIGDPRSVVDHVEQPSVRHAILIPDNG
jgi:hypothetical protein